MPDERDTWRGVVTTDRDAYPLPPHLAADPTRAETSAAEDRAFRLLVESVQDYAIFMLDQAGTVMTWNPGAARLKGYAAEEIIGQSFMRFYPPESLARGVPIVALDMAIASGRFEDEGWRLRKDGSRFWANVVITALHDEAGVLRGFAKVTRDLTDRKRSEDALRAQEARFSGSFDQAAIGMALVGLDGRWLRVNRALCAMLGYDEATLLATDFQSLTHPDDLASDLDQVGALIAGTILGYSMEKRYRHAAGHDVWGELSVSLVRDADGEPRHFYSQIQDISARKRAENLGAGQSAVARILSAATELVDAAPQLLQALVESYGWRAAELFEAASDTAPLKRAATLYPATAAAHAFGVASEQHEPVMGIGLPGRVRTLGEPLWIPDIVAESHFLRRQEAAAAGLRCCCALPIRSDGAVVGVLLLFGGTVRPLEPDLLDALRGVSNQISQFVERRRAEAALRAGEARMRTILDALNEGVVLLDAAGQIVEANPAAQRLLGQTLQQLHGMAAPNPRWRAVREDGSALKSEEYPTSLALRSGEPQRDVIVGVHGGADAPTWLQVTAQPLAGPDPLRPGGVVASFVDVTERREAQERLAYQAFHDTLTGLPNRALFLDRLGQALARTARHEDAVAVLFLDLDRFKVINDSLGHEVGDLLLVAAAERLVSCLRDEDTIARLGGDEFTILLERLRDSSEAVCIAERIVAAFMDPFWLGGHEVVVSTSVGIALASQPIDEPMDLLRDADAALYRAKQGGKARYALFDPGMHAAAMERLELETALRRAIERGEFALHYQPKVDLAARRVVGFEALVRWHHPLRGLVPPGDFIPLAEETGLILPLGRWVLAEACRQAHAWQTAYPAAAAMTMSVNLSARQFLQPDLVADVARLLDESGLTPATLRLEITETVLMGEGMLASGTLDRLKALGVGLAIDDFGKGYSSLGYLKHLPVDTLKVDRSFVLGLGLDRGDTAIVEAVITLAHSVGMVVVAEGVETPDQATILQTLGCELGQGYYFARPVPGPEIERLLAHGGHLVPLPQAPVA